MIPQWVIEKKRDGGSLSAGEIREFVAGFTSGRIPDYQMAALAMAVYFRGMSSGETAALTRAMLDSGSRLDTRAIRCPKADKHSTGGIGDKASLIVAPLAAACGLAVPMISGRGLGITGGTLDKLESIPGYRTDLSERAFLRVVERCGCSIVGQTASLAPADRKLYALRDVTGTVPSIPLIVASILSKKLAAGLDALVMDVKCGRGAFMKDAAGARALARALVDTAAAAGLPTTALITAMDEPLGRNAGNRLEVIEAVDVLRGGGPADVRALSVRLTAEMMLLARTEASLPRAKAAARARLASGAAYERFLKMVRLHGGDPRAIEAPGVMPAAPRRAIVRSASAGWVHGVDADAVGRACLLLGAGRTRTTDEVDPRVGVSDMRKTGERVERGDALAVVHGASTSTTEEAAALVRGAFAVGPRPAAAPPLVRERLRAREGRSGG